MFCLVVDNFGIKVTNMANFEHLKMALKEHYTVAVDYKGSLICDVKLTWDYAHCYIDCSIPGYIATALKKYQHATPTIPQMRRTMLLPPNTVPKCKGLRLTPRLHYPKAKSSVSRTSLAPCCTMHGPSIPLF